MKGVDNINSFIIWFSISSWHNNKKKNEYKTLSKRNFQLIFPIARLYNSMFQSHCPYLHGLDLRIKEKDKQHAHIIMSDCDKRTK